MTDYHMDDIRWCPHLAEHIKMCKGHASFFETDLYTLNCISCRRAQPAIESYEISYGAILLALFRLANQNAEYLYDLHLIIW